MSESVLVCDAECHPLLHVHDSGWIETEIRTPHGLERVQVYDIERWKRNRPATWADRMGLRRQ